MKINYKIKLSILTLISIVWIINTRMNAQESNILYFMGGIPQSYMLNPAHMPVCNFYMGLPVASLTQVNFENSTLSLSNVLEYNETTQQTITFLHPDADIDDFLKNFKNSNHISFDVSDVILAFGFRAKKSYISFDITGKSTARFSYPGDLVDLMLTGNENGEEFDLSGFGINATSYIETGVRYAREISRNLTLGARVKIITGLVNISTRKPDITLSTGLEEWDFNSEMELNMSVPGLNTSQMELGEVTLEYLMDTLDFEDPSTSELTKMGSNFGLGLDLGAVYWPIENVAISASIIDLGFIKWKNNPWNLTQTGSITFDGLRVENGFEVDSFGTQLLDSIKQDFIFNSSLKPYTSYLTGKLYVGGQYFFDERSSVGLLSKTEFYKGKLREQLTLSLNLYPVNFFAASFSYSIMNNTFNNFGIGMSFKPGPFHFYYIIDNLPLPLAKEKSTGLHILPHKTRAFNIRFGFNFMIGCNQDRKKEKDKPLFF